MRTFLIAVAGLLGTAVTSPAQLVIEGKLGRDVRVAAHIGAVGHAHRGPVHTPPIVRPVSRHRHGHDDHAHRGHGRGHGHTHGYWTTVSEEVTVPGYWREERIPARYGWVVDSCGHRIWSIVEPGCTHRVWVPPRCEVRTRRVFVRC